MPAPPKPDQRPSRTGLQTGPQTGPLPSIAAHLGVKDEIGLIGPCIAHLRAIGVSQIVVHDIASTDGTRDWLARHEGPGLTVIDSPDEATDADMQATTLAGIAGLEADWLLMLDADEFPLPRGGDLRACLAGSRADVLALPRYNVVLGPQGLRMPVPPGVADYGAIDLFAGTDRRYRKQLEANPMLTWLRFVPLPKVAVRMGPRIAGFANGMHDALPAEGVALIRATASDIVTAHVALSDYARFAAKVDNIRAMFARHDATLAANFGWTWKRWAAQAEAGTLRGEYDRSVVSVAEIEALRDMGVIASVSDLLGEDLRGDAGEG